jgi:general secretion pathway protein M
LKLALPALSSPTLDAFRTAALDWWSSRAPRERVLLAVLAAVATVYALVFLIWRPLAEARADARADIRAYEAVVAQARAAGPTLVRSAAAAPPAAAIGASAAAAGLTVRRLDPDGAGARVSLEDAPYDATVRWMETLEREHGLTVREARLERRPAPGVVNAQIRVGG